MHSPTAKILCEYGNSSQLFARIFQVILLAVSNPVKLPEQPQLAGVNDANPLVFLSGYEDFHIIRKNERQHRQKKVEANHE